MPSLKRYMVYSFASLWTAALIIALVATIIHQVRFQDSATHLHLNWEVRSLEFENRGLEFSLREKDKMIFDILSVPYYE